MRLTMCFDFIEPRKVASGPRQQEVEYHSLEIKVIMSSIPLQAEGFWRNRRGMRGVFVRRGNVEIGNGALQNARHASTTRITDS